MCVCLQVPVIAVSVSAPHRTGGCLESTASVMTGSVTNTMASSAQVTKNIGSTWPKMQKFIFELISRRTIISSYSVAGWLLAHWHASIFLKPLFVPSFATLPQLLNWKDYGFQQSSKIHETDGISNMRQKKRKMWLWRLHTIYLGGKRLDVVRRKRRKKFAWNPVNCFLYIYPLPKNAFNTGDNRSDNGQKNKQLQMFEYPKPYFSVRCSQTAARVPASAKISNVMYWTGEPTANI